MNILIYGTKKEKELLIQHIKSEPSTAFCIVNNAYTDDYDEYIDLLRENTYDVIFVMTDNAAGMEGVIAAQNVHPEAAVVWFSNDKNFVAQSYRLGVNYFSVKPIDGKQVNLAMKRCEKKGDFPLQTKTSELQ